jgi:Flp pilus assembly CpaE family ATPase
LQLVDQLQGSFDFIVLDTASKLDDLCIGLFDLSKRILLVANPTLPSVKNIRAVLNLMDQLQIDPNRSQLVFNRVNADLERAKATIASANIEANLKRKAIASIPTDDRRVLSAINHGITVVARDQQLSPAKELIALAETVRAMVTPAEQEQEGADNKASPARRGRLFGS